MNQSSSIQIMELNLKNNKKRWLVGGIVLLVLLAIVWSIFRDEAVTVEAGKVERGNLRVTIDEEGKVRNHDRYVVTAPISGQMKRVEIHEGERIPKGYVITEIDPNPPKPLDPSQNPPSVVNPYASKVYAPVAGKVLRVVEQNERIIAAGSPIIEIGSEGGRMEIVADVLSSDALQIRPGMLMLVSAGEGEERRARVRTVEPQAFTKISALGVEEQRVNVVADFLDAKTAYGDGYRVETRIVIWEGENVLKVPISALFRTGEKWSVFTIEGKKAKLREVEIRHRSAAEAEVLNGLSEGETVILHPPKAISDGTRVNIQ
jgi:multidrug efflux pump subunit AcrA (membrane-fusion protein)